MVHLAVIRFSEVQDRLCRAYREFFEILSISHPDLSDEALQILETQESVLEQCDRLMQECKSERKIILNRLMEETQQTMKQVNLLYLKYESLQ